jgi:hypothetical protein
MDEYNGEKYIKIPIKEWGHKQLVTLNLLKSEINNEDYLYNQVNSLWDATPPVTRKLFKPVAIDPDKSFGVDLNKDNTSYSISPDVNTIVHIKPIDDPKIDTSIPILTSKLIDTVKSTCVFNTINKYVTIPRETVEYLDKNTRNYSPFDNDMLCNEYWYIGFNRSKPYETRPNWVMNEEHGGIPAICRSQTFKVDLKEKSVGYGDLESVVLNLHGESLQTGVPLIVEITEAVYNDTEKIYYPASRDHINNWRYNTTKYGDGKSAQQIAKQYWYPENTDPGIVAITFDWGAQVIDGKYYAIVLRSPLNHQPNPYAVGGWNRHCDPDVYEDGDAFFSWNNGYNWIRYGKDNKVSYHEGMYAPEDFAFQCYIRQQKQQYKTGTYYLYTKPLHYEKIKTIVIGTENCYPKDGKIEYYAYNNITDEWVQFIDDTVDFGSEENRPDVTVIRLDFTLTKAGGNAPYTYGFTLGIYHSEFSHAMLRTQPYTPRTTGILAANTYNHVHCPYNVEDLMRDNVIVDVVKESNSITTLEIINLVDILKYSSSCESINTTSVKNEIERIIGTKDEVTRQKFIEEFLTKHSDILEELRLLGVYVLEDHNFKSFYVGGECAYPIIRCSYQPYNDETVDFSEWLDYTVNYDDTVGSEGNTLTFNNNSVKQFTSSGHLTIKFNPIFAKDIPQSSVSTNNTLGGTDIVKDIDLGFIKQPDYIVKADDLKSNVLSIVLYTEALNPLREVKIVRDNSNDIILVEEEDYNVDYDNKTIYIKNTNNDVLKVNDIIRIKYIPYLVNDSISLCYHLNRQDTDDNITIYGNYIDYKT